MLYGVSMGDDGVSKVDLAPAAAGGGRRGGGRGGLRAARRRCVPRTPSRGCPFPRDGVPTAPRTGCSRSGGSSVARTCTASSASCATRARCCSCATRTAIAPPGSCRAAGCAAARRRRTPPRARPSRSSGAAVGWRPAAVIEIRDHKAERAARVRRGRRSRRRSLIDAGEIAEARWAAPDAPPQPAPRCRRRRSWKSDPRGRGFGLGCAHARHPPPARRLGRRAHRGDRRPAHAAPQVSGVFDLPGVATNSQLTVGPDGDAGSRSSRPSGA